VRGASGRPAGVVEELVHDVSERASEVRDLPSEPDGANIKGRGPFGRVES
jgi:hypothetical protein